ncbi:PAS domain-containing protein [Natranaerofaba carboxydovora]|uniref:PAS domain-containing protein n=1 Tax=Natranaerofaba carboxydovora TaxID=2742683 RepID=UPI001F12971D|nr:PAS domain-containing protein [Natranaerofaba carboxydovora]UMZ74908.1 hypothetical protein ACONDI_02512 [Natranaerofaba carboxydovora]
MDEQFEKNIMFFVHDTFFYKDIIDSLPMPLATIDSKGKVYFVNEAWKEFFEKYTGLTKSDFYGEDVTILFGEIFMEQDIDDEEKSEAIVSKLKDLIFNNDLEEELNFEAVIDGAVNKFKVRVFTFHGTNEERDKKDKILLLEKEKKKI